MNHAANRLTIRRPDDWHLHLRDGAMLEAVLPHSAGHFGRAIIMPNLVPPVTDMASAEAYRQRILAALPAGAAFEPLMTCYLTDDTDADEVERGFNARLFRAVKLYPARATTNSAFGVTEWSRITGVLERMEKIGMPLLVHGEEADPEIDIFDREAVFIDRVLSGMVKDFPGLRLVLEHATTTEGVDFVAGAGANIAATITPHHLMINRNDILVGGIRPHLYCLPVAKREVHRLALRKAATSGHDSFFLGTDSAPHPVEDKENDCGCAGIFNSPVALACCAQVFEEDGALDVLEKFTSVNGPAFYGLDPNEDTVTLHREPWTVPLSLPVADRERGIRPFAAGEILSWRVCYI